MGATLGDTDPDTATGKEGDVEARCFRASPPAHFLAVLILTAECQQNEILRGTSSS